MKKPLLLSYKDLEEEYGLKKSTMSKRVMNGKFIIPIMIGKKCFFKRDEVDQWIEEQRAQQ